MTRGMIYKSLFILFIIILGIILILPTIGAKKMVVFLSDSVTQNEIDAIRTRFSAEEYNVARKGNTLEIEGSGIKITDAVMNEAKRFNGVNNAKILPHWAEKAVLAKKITLGLDLQGGTHLVLMADFGKILEQTIAEMNILLEKKKSLEGSLSNKEDKEKIKSDIESIDQELKHITESKLTDTNTLKESFKSEITQQALELLRNRVDKFGVSEPSIRPRGNEAIEIQLPGVKDPNSVKEAIGKTGRVQYMIVDDEYSLKAKNWLVSNYKEKELPNAPEMQKELLAEISKKINLPINLQLLFLYQRNDKQKNALFPIDIMALQRKVALEGSDISKAWIGKDDYQALIVQFKTTPEGAAKFAAATAPENKGKRLAIIIDDKIRSAPQINEQIASGSAQITGDFTYDEVNALSRIIQEGALPVDLKIVEERTVGPSLGQDSIESGLKAMIYGLAAVIIFMIAWYKGAGIIAVFGLILNTLFMFAFLSWLGFTLTLPGIAGFILTVGMAVDANVIIYERLKEEFRAGKSVRMTISNGFDRAFWSIFDSNLTTLIAAFVLGQYGTGPVKGFAVTLSVGVISSMFVALYITKFIFEGISLNKNIKKLSI